MTPHRPHPTTGRSLDASLLTFDLPSLLSQIKEEDTWQKGERSAMTLRKGQGQRVVLVAMHAHTTISSHRAGGPLSLQVIEGRLKFSAGSQALTLNKGQLLTLRAGIPHAVEAVEESAFLLTLAVDTEEEERRALGVWRVFREERAVAKPAPPARAVAVQEHRRLLPADGRPAPSLKAYEEAGGLIALRRARGMTREAIIDEIARSGLRGRGGAGFPTGDKWASVLDGGTGARYVCCNAAEGEPGTFKDRYLLRMNPYPVLEGLAIAAYAVGASRSFVCLKRSFTREVERVSAAIKEFRAAGLLDGLDIDLVAGPDEYLFGEEKALLEVVEGSLPMPRVLPPYIEGLFRHPPEENPTLVNNAETLANIPLILRAGVEEFQSTGAAGSPGTMIFTVSGDVRRPGCYELPLGTSLRVLIEQFGGGVLPGRTLKAVFPGASNAVLTADDLDAPLAFDALRDIGSGLGSGGFVVYDDSACMATAAALFSRFLYVESCAQCPPCKFGSGEITAYLERLARGEGSQFDFDTALARCGIVATGNRCALPVGERVLVESLLRKFPDEFRTHFGAPCPFPRSLVLPKFIDLDPEMHIFTYDERQRLKQPDWTFSVV